MKLLYAEDEISMSEAVVDILTYHNFSVDAVYDGQTALDFARTEKYDGIILDIMMPRLDGIEVLKTLRKEKNQAPIMLLTAKSEIDDRIEGLNSGADDYLPKPFAMGELLARIYAMLRRKDNYNSDILTFGNTSLNLQSFELSTDNKTILLSKVEYKLIESLMLNLNIFLSSEDILIKVWGYESDIDVGSVWVYISYLRKRLKEINSDIEIIAKRNIGYKLEKLK